ncbi:MAG: outer membrane beta-barrel family protein [Azospirillaceae bacterium]|nr:outer membrane beta-barrel family protein [Azospirillaceae bacterium]
MYDLRNNLQAKSGSVSDVLATLPSVNVDPEGKVSVRGASVDVLVDGKPSAALRGNLVVALQSIAADTIDRIEVITDPGPEFRSNAAALINIITKKTKVPELKGDLTLNAGPHGRRNGSFSGSVGVDKWVFSGTASLRQDIRYDIQDTDLTALGAAGSTDSRRVARRGTFVPYTNAAASLDARYAATDHDSFDLGAEGALRYRPRRYLESATRTDTTGDVTGDSVIHDAANQHFNHYSVTGDYVRKGLAGGDTLTLKATHEQLETTRGSTDVEDFLNPPAPQEIYRQPHDERERIDTVSGDYVLPLPRGAQLKLGFDAQFDRDRTSHSASGSNDAGGGAAVGLATRFHLDQTLAAAYADYQRPLGTWTVKAGLRLETQRSDFQQDTDLRSGDRDDVQWSPSLSLSRDLTPDSTLSFNYRRRIERPSTDQLNPLPTVVGSVIGMGNPDLKPGRVQSLDARYSYAATPVDFSATLYARTLSDQVIGYDYTPVAGATTLVSSYENAGSGSTEGLDISLDLHLSSAWTVNLSSDLSHVRQTAPIDGIDYTGSVLTHETKLGLTWTPDADDSFQVKGQLRGRSLAAGGSRSGYGALNLAYGHDFSPRLKLVASVNDVLNTVRYTEVVDTTQYRERWTMTVPGQVFYVGLSYKLGALGPAK